jgi:hypothetical protein
MERVLDVYQRHYNEHFPVICMDESPKQLIKDVRISVPMKPGQDARVNYEYFRHGVVNIFIRLTRNPEKGTRLLQWSILDCYLIYDVLNG